jgi:hypothetical protein
MDNNIIIRDITPSDETGLIELYDKVWPETAGEKYGKTKWMLSSSVFYGVCTCVEGKIIGSRPSFYSNVYYGDRKLCAVQCGNSCVDNEYRRYGIFSKMNSLFLQKFFDEDKYDLIYNVSVYASKMAYQKLGWVYIDALAKLTCFANIWSVAWKTKLNIKKLSGKVMYHKKDIPNFDDFDYKLLEIREDYLRKKVNIHTYYNKDFFQWRLHSDSNIAIHKVDNLGVVLYKIGKRKELRIITIGEVFLYDYSKKNIKKVIRSLKKSFDVDIFEIAITEQHPCYPFYRKAGFVINPFKKYLNLGVKVVSDEMKQICLNSQNWALSTLDIDTF